MTKTAPQPTDGSTAIDRPGFEPGFGEPLKGPKEPKVQDDEIRDDLLEEAEDEVTPVEIEDEDLHEDDEDETLNDEDDDDEDEDEDEDLPA